MDKNITCQYCNSTNVTIELAYNEILRDTCEVYKRKKIRKHYICHCNDCGWSTIVNVNYGKDTYTVYLKPQDILKKDNTIKLLAEFTSDSFYDYKIIQDDSLLNKPVYYILVENDRYPIFIGNDEDSLNRFLNNLDYTKEIIKKAEETRYS